jgi:putative methyltransferase (TIGR04325 family)
VNKAPIAIWEGVHNSLPAAKGPGFDSARWVESCRQRVAGLATAPDDSAGFLPSAAALALARRGRVRVLDFGGGPGATFASLAAALPARARVDYHIVDNPQVCRVGRARFRSDLRVRFHSSLPALNNIDIVHAQSSFQYIEDWQGLLHSLARYRSPVLAVTDLPAGKFKTYAARQNYYGSRIPYWFFNLAAFERAVERNGYRLAARTRYLGRYFGQYQDLPQANYPVRLQVGKTWNLLFTNE